MGALDGRTALVTGASKGIGAELAMLCAREGAQVILVARSAEDLEDAAERIRSDCRVATTVIPADLSMPEAAEGLRRRIDERGLSVDVLVNNAGVGAWGRFHEIEREREDRTVSLNVVALTQLTRCFVLDMISRRWGRVLNVASTAGFQGTPYMAVYGATKAYVLAFSEALSEELRPLGIAVTCLAPGTTSTGFFDTAPMRAKAPGMMSPAAVAHAGIRGLIKGDSLVVPGLLNKAMVGAQRLTPRALVTKVAGVVMRGRET